MRAMEVGTDPRRGEEEGFSFDAQAAGFDARTGIPAAAAARIAAAVAEVCVLHGGELVVEIGAGTGEIGCDLARGPAHYLGLDKARPMLALFREKLVERALAACLLQADANRAWPLAGGCARSIFLSRSAHLIEPEHLAREARRVGSPRGAWLVVGRVRRPAESIRARMRRAMREILRSRGCEGRSGEQADESLARAMTSVGGEVLAARAVATWEADGSPERSLASWRAKEGLAGRAITPEVKRAVLAELEAWARAQFGGLNLVERAVERYEITPFRLRGK